MNPGMSRRLGSIMDTPTMYALQGSEQWFSILSLLRGADSLDDLPNYLQREILKAEAEHAEGIIYQLPSFEQFAEMYG